jgi:hypothetical protein
MDVSVVACTAGCFEDWLDMAGLLSDFVSCFFCDRLVTHFGSSLWRRLQIRCVLSPKSTRLHLYLAAPTSTATLMLTSTTHHHQHPINSLFAT